VAERVQGGIQVV